MDYQTYQSRYAAPQYSPSSKADARYYCMYADCGAKHTAFARKADLERHVYIRHNPETLERVDCPERSCHRKGQQWGFTRKDKMIEHMREVHKEKIPKRSPGRRGS